MVSEKRLINLMKRLVEDDCFISGGSPRITHAERLEIQDRLHVSLQVEHLHGAEPGGPVVVFPINRFDFAARVRHYILSGESYSDKEAAE
ncbi:MAG: hypothetical protein EHM39_04305 [Chloroflexi bacterium]|nr:MAG: hypothetical protein EHM39_04305 [Chloroflexota bacterium]